VTIAIKKFFAGLTAVAIAALFVSLGFWQLGRAQEMRKAVSTPAVVDTKLYPLESLLKPTDSLNGAAIGKTVTATGHYIADFKAPNQVDAQGKRADWHVSLLETDMHSAILVVRGLWSEATSDTSPQIVMANSVTVTGTLQPHQSTDVAENNPQQLSRIDPSVLTSMIDTQLYDGYIIIKSESIHGQSVDRTRVTAAVSDYAKKVPGYYWQHISYVGIWWLMAALVIWLPFYSRKTQEG